MKYTEWITYKGKTFLLVKMVRLTEEQFIEAMREYRREWEARPNHSTLIDHTGTPVTLNVNKEAKQIQHEMQVVADKNHWKPMPVALIGTSLMARTVINLMPHKSKMFCAENLESAKEWLYENS